VEARCGTEADAEGCRIFMEINLARGQSHHKALPQSQAWGSAFADPGSRGRHDLEPVTDPGTERAQIHRLILTKPVNAVCEADSLITRKAPRSARRQSACGGPMMP